MFAGVTEGVELVISSSKGAGVRALAGAVAEAGGDEALG